MPRRRDDEVSVAGLSGALLHVRSAARGAPVANHQRVLCARKKKKPVRTGSADDYSSEQAAA